MIPFRKGTRKQRQTKISFYKAHHWTQRYEAVCIHRHFLN